MAESNKNIRTCIFCGKKYRYCNCEEYAHLPKFMLAFCGQDCNDLISILTNYGVGKIDAETAYEQMKGKDVSRLEFWEESARNTYNQIMEKVGHKVKSDEVENIAMEPPIEEPIENTVTKVIDDIKVEEQPKHQPKYKAEIKRNKQK